MLNAELLVPIRAWEVFRQGPGKGGRYDTKLVLSTMAPFEAGFPATSGQKGFVDWLQEMQLAVGLAKAAIIVEEAVAAGASPEDSRLLIDSLEKVVMSAGDRNTGQGFRGVAGVVEVLGTILSSDRVNEIVNELTVWESVAASTRGELGGDTKEIEDLREELERYREAERQKNAVKQYEPLTDSVKEILRKYILDNLVAIDEATADREVRFLADTIENCRQGEKVYVSGSNIFLDQFNLKGGGVSFEEYLFRMPLADIDRLAIADFSEAAYAAKAAQALLDYEESRLRVMDEIYRYDQQLKVDKARDKARSALSGLVPALLLREKMETVINS